MDLLVWLAIFVVGPFVGGVVLDWPFGFWPRWWRWWFPPLLVGLTGVVLLTFMWGAVGDEGSTNESGLFVVYLFVSLQVVLLPLVMSAGGVLMRRLVWWLIPQRLPSAETRI